MHGFYIGDMIANSYTHENELYNLKVKNFALFTPRTKFSDDTILTFATIDWLLHTNHTSLQMLECVRKFYKIYPDISPTIYGEAFAAWANSGCKGFRESYGNGGAMRCSPIAWYANSYEEIDKLIENGITPTHNTPSAKFGAKIVCYTIFFLKTNKNKRALKQFLQNTFFITFPESYERYHRNYTYTSDALETIMPALVSFFHGKSFIDCLRNAVSFGGDTDTITTITASIAEAYYENIPKHMIKTCQTYLPQQFKNLLNEFCLFLENKQP